MNIRLAFAGFRHGHIIELYHRAIDSDEIEVVAACESDHSTREQIKAQDIVKLTHDNVSDMLGAVNCDAVAIGDYYSRRGSLIIQALARQACHLR